MGNFRRHVVVADDEIETADSKKFVNSVFTDNSPMVFSVLSSMVPFIYLLLVPGSGKSIAMIFRAVGIAVDAFGDVAQLARCKPDQVWRHGVEGKQARQFHGQVFVFG